MHFVARSVLGAAMLLTGVSTAMAQSASPSAAYQSSQTSASQPAPAPTSAPTAYGYEAPKSKPVILSDREDLHGGFDPSSTRGARAFWEGRQNQY